MTLFKKINLFSQNGFLPIFGRKNPFAEQMAWVSENPPFKTVLEYFFAF
jgi:hypothetical protein